MIWRAEFKISKISSDISFAECENGCLLWNFDPLFSPCFPEQDTFSKAV